MNDVHERNDDHGAHPPAGPIGWPRAILSAAIVVAVGIGVLVYGTNAVLTNVHGKTRSSLVAIVTPAFFVLLFALAWVLRRLQRRGII